MSVRGLWRRGWNPWHAAGLMVLGTVGVLATADAWADMLRIALRDEEMSHVFLVPVVAAWLVWVRRERLRGCQPEGTAVGPALAAIGWLMHVVGDLFLVQVLWHAGAVTVVVGCLLSVLGLQVLVRFLPAFVALAFLLPVPGTIRQQIALPLQDAAARVTEFVLDLAGVPVTRSGNVLAINGTQVAIAEACNGLRMVFALTMVSYAFAFGVRLRNAVRVLVVAASPLLAILVNVVRLCVAVWLYGYHEHTLADAWHDVSGWLMMPAAFLVLMGALRVLRWALVPVMRYTLAYD